VANKLIEAFRLHVSGAIEHGLIAGTANLKSLVPNVQLSADTGAMQQFSIQYDKQIFTKDVITLHREH
jgi:hypothetical protein